MYAARPGLSPSLTRTRPPLFSGCPDQLSAVDSRDGVAAGVPARPSSIPQSLPTDCAVLKQPVAIGLHRRLKLFPPNIRIVVARAVQPHRPCRSPVGGIEFARMQAYGATFKARVVQRLMSPRAVSANRLAATLGVSKEPPSRWPCHARSAEGMPAPKKRTAAR
jgi:hypothetical protein